MADNQVLIQIRADVADINAKLADVRGYIGKITDETKRMADQGTTSWQMMAAGIAGVVYLFNQAKQAISQVAAPILDMARAFGEQEQVTLRLTSVLAAHGITSKEVVDAYADMASAMQKTTQYSDEQIASVQEVLTNWGVMPSKMREAVETTIALAVRTGDLNSAAEILGQAFDGNTRRLGRLLPGIKGLETGSLSAGDAMKRIRSAIGDTAQREAEGYIGKVKQLDNAWGDFKETLGQYVVPALKSLIEESMNGIHALERLMGVNTLAWKRKELQLVEEKIKAMEKGAAPTVGGEFAQYDKGGEELKALIDQKNQLTAEIAAADAKNKETLNKADKDFIKTRSAAGDDKAKSAREAWEAVARGLQAEMEKAELFDPLEKSLVDFENSLVDLDRKVADLLEKAAKLPTAGERKEAKALVVKYKEAETGKLVEESAQKGIDEYLKKEKDALALEKAWEEIFKKRQSAREAEINAQLASLDIAEKEGTYHRDTIEERIRLMNELKTIQEDYLATLDKMKDASAWYAQANAINATKTKILELRAEFTPLTTALRAYADNATNVGEQLGTALTGAFKGAEDVFVEFCMNGKASFSDFAKSIAADLLRIQVRSLITGPAASWLGSLLSFTGGASGNASGNAFSRGYVLRFADGGVFDKPTYFRMANGIGLMGEAGPEAVMPLARGPDGKLGVKAAATAGGISVPLSISFSLPFNDKKLVSALRSEIEGKLPGMVEGVIKRHM